MISNRQYTPSQVMSNGISCFGLPQRKLVIGASNDPRGTEADRVADRVLAAPTASVVSGATFLFSSGWALASVQADAARWMHGADPARLGTQLAGAVYRGLEQWR